MKKPIVKLINFTPHPIETMMFGWKNMHGKLPNTLEEFMADPLLTPQLKMEFAAYLAAEPLSGGVQEFVSMVWLFKDVSRAFQQQLTRHRTAAYSIQSLRVVPCENFADNDDFHVPENAINPSKFTAAMDNIQAFYRSMLEKGEKVEVARGILPLNIFSPITMCINLRGLVGFISSRLCHMAQGEIREVALMMIDEVAKKMGPEFRHLFYAPCEPSEFCPHADGVVCGWKPQFPYCEGRNTEAMKAFMKS